MVLNDEQQAEYERLLKTEQFQGAARMATTSLEKGLEKGLEQGRKLGIAVGERKIVSLLLTRRFGDLNEDVTVWLEGLDEQQLAVIAERILDAKSLEELGFPGEPKK